MGKVETLNVDMDAHAKRRPTAATAPRGTARLKPLPTGRGFQLQLRIHDKGTLRAIKQHAFDRDMSISDFVLGCYERCLKEGQLPGQPDGRAAGRRR